MYSRVPSTDSIDDEPAGALLERVQAERTISVNSPRRRRGADAVTLEAFGSKEIEPIDGS